MHYVAIVDGAEVEVEIVEVSSDRYQIQLDGEHRFDMDARPTSDNSLSCLVDEQVYDVEIENDRAGGQNLMLRGHVVHAEVLDLRRMRLRKAQQSAVGPDGPATVASPMPGKVVAVMVKEGDAVIEGQGLLVVEAMKMENELRSPRAGVIKNLKAQEGAAVDGGVALCVVE